jgi:hypothetical protein
MKTNKPSQRGPKGRRKTPSPATDNLTTSMASKDIFPFEKLAPELRNEIYELLLVAEHPIIISRKVNENALDEDDRHLAHGNFHQKLSKARNIENAYVFTGKTKAQLSSQAKLIHYPFGQLHHTTILHLNKAISGEAKGVLYGCNKFIFDNPTLFQGFIKRIASGKAAMSDITIHHVGNLKPIPEFKHIPSLRRLTLRPTMSRGHLWMLEKSLTELVVRWVVRGKTASLCERDHGDSCICSSTLTLESLSKLINVEVRNFTVLEIPPTERAFEPERDTVRLMELMFERLKTLAGDHKLIAESNERAESNAGEGNDY